MDEEKLNNGSPSLDDIVWATGEIFDSIKQIPVFKIWGKSGKYIVEEAAKMRTSMRATAKFQNPKMKENALAIAKKAEAANKVLTGLGMIASLAEVISSYNGICEAWNDASKSLDEKILETLAAGSYAGEGICKLIAGSQIILTNLPKELGKGTEMLGKAASGFKIAGGVFTSIKAIEELSGENLEQKDQAGAVCDWISGILDIAGGACEFSKVFAPLAIPLGALSSAVSIAGGFFRAGEWFKGSVVIAIGVVVSALLFTLIVTFNSTIATALGLASTSFAATLMLSVVGIAAGLAALAVAGLLIAEMVKSKPPKTFAQGGFPVYGQPFIAREAGPELVGTLDGHTAVVNNDQIVEAVSVGVFSAWKAAWNDNSSNAPAIARVFLDGKQMNTKR